MFKTRFAGITVFVWTF